MKKTTLLVLALFNILLIACNSSDSTPERDNSIAPPGAQNSFNMPDSTAKLPQLNQAPQPGAPAATTQAPNITAAPGSTTSPAITTQAPTMTVAPQQGKTAAGMNPPHGQPGHRCEIAVGAPLNSAPAAATTPSKSPVVTTSSTPVSAPQAVQQSSVKTAPGMNPPHGQPGHRCDISVGAPLSSPPTNKTATAVDATPVVSDPTGARPQVKEEIKKVSDSSKN